MKRIILTLFILFFVIISLLLLLTRSFPDLNTVYMQDFSYEKFNKIQVGMDKNQVRNILGEPFRVWRPGNECWTYSKYGKPGELGLGDFFGWRSVQVCFGGNELVNSMPNVVF